MKLNRTLKVLSAGLLTVATTANACIQSSLDLTLKGTSLARNPVVFNRGTLTFNEGTDAAIHLKPGPNRKWCYTAGPRSGLPETGCLSSANKTDDTPTIDGKLFGKAIPILDKDGRRYAEITMFNRQPVVHALDEYGKRTGARLTLKNLTQGPDRLAMSINAATCSNDKFSGCAGSTITTVTDLRIKSGGFPSKRRQTIDLSANFAHWETRLCGGPTQYREGDLDTGKDLPVGTMNDRLDLPEGEVPSESRR